MLKFLLSSFCFLFAVHASAIAAEQEKQPAERHFEFTYGGEITDLAPDATARVWLPVASSDADQQVKRVSVEVPAKFTESKDEECGNPLLFFEAQANDKGEIPFRVVYRVRRRQVLVSNAEQAQPELTTRFLRPTTHVPIDAKLRSSLLGRKATLPQAPIDLAKTLYDAVGNRMSYDKPEGGLWGRGDAAWACQSGYGNCTDFHSLFLSACRTSGVPGKFEIGFPIPKGRDGTVAGYHCWARFLANGRWIPVDISEADKHPELKDYYFGNLTADRILFSTGRDLTLVPASATQRVNYLIYPHVEVQGKVHKSFRKGFRFRELDDR